ncbi:MAG: radical SAM/SPASM domain-containing protein [Nitrospina sp.]|nr:radical SAM/SPASM domain-containing protein [Nitrospina sp.]
MTVKEVEQLNLEMDGSCNINCPMCPQSTGREEGFLEKFPMELFRKVVDEAIPLGLKFVNLSGSGEPLLSKDLEEAVAYLTKNKISSMIYSNGTALTPKRFENLCQAGLTVCKISCMGWDRESYAKWMSLDAFDRVRENLKACLNILKNNDYGTELQTNHLIQDHSQLKYQKEQYLKNWVNYLEINAEIWLTHNWSGLYGEESVARHTIFNERRKRTCGRPLAKVLEIRAGGLEGKKGAVVPCPNVLGQDSKAIMGYVEDQSLLEILNGEKMRHLREVHLRETFDEIDYCKNCDQLIDVEDALVWTNVPGRVYGESRISGISYVGAEKDWQNESV